MLRDKKGYYPSVGYYSPPIGPAYKQDNPDPFELICKCIYCTHEGLHYLLDIRKIIKTDEDHTLGDDLRMKTRYRGTRYRLIKRECFNCRQPWEQILDKEYGTWYEIGEA